jgi:hypothetical protein
VRIIGESDNNLVVNAVKFSLSEVLFHCEYTNLRNDISKGMIGIESNTSAEDLFKKIPQNGRVVLLVEFSWNGIFICV